MVIFLLLAVSIKTAEKSPLVQNHLDYQLHCMRNLLRIPHQADLQQSLQERMLLRPKTSLENPCTWDGVLCLSQILIRISWGPEIKGHSYDLHWFPSALMEVFIEGRELKSELHPGILPRAMRRFSMKRCGLIGPLDLRRLPKKMEALYLRTNRFSGKLYLTALPENIEYVDLVYNNFKEALVVGEALPESLVEIRLGYLKVKWLDGVKDERIYTDKFRGM